MGTVTSDFGSTTRESHDSSAFYSRFESFPMSRVTDALEEVPSAAQDRIFCASSELMGELPNGCISLMVTSPPYHVGKEYDTDTDFDEYLDLLISVLTESYRVLQPGGRAAINLANLGRKPYIPLTSFVDAACQEIGFLPRGQIIWIKGEGANGSCAWGSFQSAANPVIRDVHEYILLYSKGQYGKAYKGESTLTKEEFLEYTLSTWRMQPARAKTVGHPAPFPVELPRRLIKLFTYKGDTILDPFIGAGATALAAAETGRHYVGYDNNADYVQLAQQRIAQAKE